jgi:phage shock protein PspC (stress-responsive transcriptional regulator)
MSSHPVRPRLARSSTDRWVAGVCGGIAEYTGLNPGAVRLLFVLFGWFGPATLLYVALWIMMPKE